MKLPPRSLLAVAAFVALSLALHFATPTLAEPGQVMAIKSKKLNLYSAADGPRVDSLPGETVETPIAILEVAPNNRLKVEIGGKLYWLAPHQVETNEKITVEVRCRDQVTSYASTRGNLEKCKP